MVKLPHNSFCESKSKGTHFENILVYQAHFVQVFGEIGREIARPTRESPNNPQIEFPEIPEKGNPEKGGHSAPDRNKRKRSKQKG
jgi:hypothetical protein